MSASLLIWFTEINNTVQHTMYTKNTGKDLCSLKQKKVLHSIILPPPSFFVSSAVNSDNCTITWKLRLMNGHKDIKFMNYLHDWCVITLSRGVTVGKPENAYEPKVPLALIFPKWLIGMDSKQCLMEPEPCFKSRQTNFHLYNLIRSSRTEVASWIPESWLLSL